MARHLERSLATVREPSLGEPRRAGQQGPGTRGPSGDDGSIGARWPARACWGRGKGPAPDRQAPCHRAVGPVPRGCGEPERQLRARVARSLSRTAPTQPTPPATPHSWPTSSFHARPPASRGSRPRARKGLARPRPLMLRFSIAHVIGTLRRDCTVVRQVDGHDRAHRCFGGWQRTYHHASRALGVDGRRDRPVLGVIAVFPTT